MEVFARCVGEAKAELGQPLRRDGFNRSIAGQPAPSDRLRQVGQPGGSNSGGEERAPESEPLIDRGNDGELGIAGQAGAFETCPVPDPAIQRQTRVRRPQPGVTRIITGQQA